MTVNVKGNLSEDMAVMNGLVMDPAVHEPIPDGHWIQTLREKTGVEGLFVYHHKGVGSFVVAEWVKKPAVYGQGISACTEIVVMSAPPDHHPDDLPSMEEMMERCKPGHILAEQNRRMREEEEKDFAAKLEASDVERHDAARYARRRGMEGAAFTLEEGGAPFIGEMQGGEELSELKERLNHISSGRIIDTG
jgi:hypothetical protein